MNTLFFFSNRDNLSIALQFFGFVATGYALQLIDVDGMTPLFNPPASGVNTDNVADFIDLPTPVSANNGRFLELTISFIGSDPINFPNYHFDLELHQNGTFIGKESRSGQLTGSDQRETITVRLQAI